MGWFTLTVLVLDLIGILLAGSFLFVHRPARWRSMAALDASAWVVIVALALGRSLLLIVLRGSAAVSVVHGATDIVVGLGLLALVDAILALRLLAFLRFRRSRHRGGPPVL